MSYVIWWPKFVRSPGWDHRHDEESQNGWDIKIDILEGYIRTSEWFRRSSGIFRSTGRLPKPLPVTRYAPATPRTLPVSEYHHTIYINIYLSTILRLLVMSVITSGTPNKLRSPKHITHNTNRHRTLSVRTLRVRELCRHDWDPSPVNNQHQDLDAHIGPSIYYEDLYRLYRNDNIRYSLCHWYVTCPRFDRQYHHT